MAIFKPDFFCNFCNKITDVYIESANFFYCVDCDRNRRTLLNVKSGSLTEFETQTDLLIFQSRCEHLGHYNSWIITLHEYNEKTREEIIELQDKGGVR